jgi:hypothetical protein
MKSTLASLPAPPIAINAADQPFAVMVDLDELAIALLAGIGASITRAHDKHSPC